MRGCFFLRDDVTVHVHNFRFYFFCITKLRCLLLPISFSALTSVVFTDHFIDKSVRSFVRSFVPSFVRSSVRSFVRSFVRWFPFRHWCQIYSITHRCGIILYLFILDFTTFLIQNNKILLFFCFISLISWYEKIPFNSRYTS